MTTRVRAYEDPEILDEIERAWNALELCRDIAERLGMSESQVSRARDFLRAQGRDLLTDRERRKRQRDSGINVFGHRCQPMTERITMHPVSFVMANGARGVVYGQDELQAARLAAQLGKIA